MSPAKKPMMIVQMIPIVLSSHLLGGPVTPDLACRLERLAACNVSQLESSRQPARAFCLANHFHHQTIGPSSAPGGSSPVAAREQAQPLCVRGRDQPIQNDSALAQGPANPSVLG